MKLISLALYGDKPLYCAGAVQNAILRQVIYPDWTMRVYAAPDVPEVTIRVLRSFDVQVHVLPNPGGIFPMFQRFWPAGESGIEAVIFRDADSRLGLREKAAVDAWLASGKRFHVMRDHEHHKFWPMLGGMWGCLGGSLPDISKQIVEWGDYAEKLADMRFLAEKVWPDAQKSMVHHSSVETPHPGAVPFPPHKPCMGFVGQVVHPDGRRENPA